MSSEAVAAGCAVVALANITVGAENPAIVMAFVDDDELEVAQEHCPAGVVAQQRQMNHVGIGEDPSRSFTRESPHFARTVAVV
jgi:hypothetical protein